MHRDWRSDLELPGTQHWTVTALRVLAWLDLGVGIILGILAANAPSTSRFAEEGAACLPPGCLVRGTWFAEWCLAGALAWLLCLGLALGVNAAVYAARNARVLAESLRRAEASLGRLDRRAEALLEITAAGKPA